MPEVDEPRTILGNIQRSHRLIIEDPEGYGKTEAKRLGDLAIVAILGGMNSTAWRNYVQNFASTPEQLARLSGDDEFMSVEYGPETLAYIVANSTCTTDTHLPTTGLSDGNKGTLNFVDAAMQAKLDYTLPPGA